MREPEAGLRSASTAATRARLEPLLASYGITRVSELTGLDYLGLPVMSAVRPSAATVVTSTGKGATPDAAWVSAVMESIEAAASESHAPPVAWEGMAADRPDLGYSVKDLNLHAVAAVSDRSVLAWEVATDLVSAAPSLVPTASVGLRGWSGMRWLPSAFVTTSNGLAAGSEQDEATVHGLLELVERDALARATAEEMRSGADVRCAPGTRTAVLVKALQAQGMSVRMVALPAITGAHVVVAYLSCPDMPQAFGGSGAHPELEHAGEKALMEAVQSRMSVISGLRDDISADAFLQDVRPRVLQQGGVRGAADPLGQRSPADPDDTPARTSASLVSAIHARTGKPVLRCVLSDPAAYPTVVQVQAPGLLPSPGLPLPSVPTAAAG